jgi:hypothetical protein
MQEGPSNNLNTHLEKGVKPIMVCVGTPNEFGTDFVKDFDKKTKDNPPTALNVNYLEAHENIERQKFLTNGDQAYVISTVDGLDKGSVGFMNCTGLVVCGVDKITGENVSFLTHQNPIQLFVFNGKSDFIKHLGQQLKEIKNRCKPGTIDAIVVGGVLDSGYKTEDDAYKKDYIECLKLLSGEVIKILGFDPVVVNGPKLTTVGDDWDSVYFF